MWQELQNDESVVTLSATTVAPPPTRDGAAEHDRAERERRGEARQDQEPPDGVELHPEEGREEEQSSTRGRRSRSSGRAARSSSCRSSRASAPASARRRSGASRRRPGEAWASGRTRRGCARTRAGRASPSRKRLLPSPRSRRARVSCIAGAASVPRVTAARKPSTFASGLAVAVPAVADLLAPEHRLVGVGTAWWSWHDAHPPRRNWRPFSSLWQARHDISSPARWWGASGTAPRCSSGSARTPGRPPRTPGGAAPCEPWQSAQEGAPRVRSPSSALPWTPAVNRSTTSVERPYGATRRVGVAPAAGRRLVGARGGRARILGARIRSAPSRVARTVAVGAHGDRGVALPEERLAVVRRAVVGELVGREPVGSHPRGVRVAAAAEARDLLARDLPVKPFAAVWDRSLSRSAVGSPPWQSVQASDFAWTLSAKPVPCCVWQCVAQEDREAASGSSAAARPAAARPSGRASASARAADEGRTRRVTTGPPA